MSDFIYALQSRFQDIPFLASLLLGVLVAISPCTIAANLAALSFVSVGCDTKKSTLTQGTFLVLGKSLVYIVLAILLSQFAGAFEISDSFADVYVQIIGVLFIIVGVLMLDIIHLHGLEDIVVRMFKGENKKNIYQTLLIGMLLALAFCPDGAVLYFGMMIPLTIAENHSLMVPLFFAIGAAIPLLVVVALYAYGMERVASMTKIFSANVMVRKFVGAMFIIAGICFITEFIFHHAH
ncbi:MAG: sulfite exporter TauE/SafE family protein [Bacteroidales bacterium]|nr:sulfite exporter TauE/SafE family protein [Candidatus Scybalocola fimicaballi]